MKATLAAIFSVALAVSLAATLSPSTVYASETSGYVTILDESFFIDKNMSATSTPFEVGSFKAKIGYWVKLDVKSTRNVFLRIVSGNNRVIFNVSAMSFEQSVNIDYNENFTIIMDRNFPFYVDARVKGQIDVYHQELNRTLPTPSPLPSPTPSISASDSPTQQPTIEPTQSAQPTIGTVVTVIVAVTIVGLAVYSSKHGKKKEAN
jgi:hypothetical protein